MKNTHYAVILCVIVAYGCSVKSNDLDPTEHIGTPSVVKRLTSKVSHETIGDLGVYESMFDANMNTVYIHDIRIDQRSGRIYRGVDYYNVDIEDPDTFMRKLRINGNCPFEAQKEPQEYFGKTLRFSCGDDNNITAYSQEDGFQSTRSIHITSPDVNQAEQMTPLCYAGDFVVRWDRDSTNVNGVVIGVRWSGIMLFGDDYPDTEVVCLETFPDTGSATLSQQMFSCIPDTAYCQLILLRASFDTITLDNDFVRIITESADILKFALIKNIIFQEDTLCAE